MTASATLSSRSPARIAAYGGIALGAAFVLFGAWLLLASQQAIVLAVAFVVAGIVEGVTSWFSLRAVRVAWAFACTINGTLGVMFLFGSPKLRDTAEIHIGFALTPCVVLGLITVFYAISGDDY